MPKSQTNPLHYETLLDGMKYPSSKAEIINHVQDKGATPEIMEHFSAMPNNSFNSSLDVMDSIGNINPLPHHGHPSNREGDNVGTISERTNQDASTMAENT